MTIEEKNELRMMMKKVGEKLTVSHNEWNTDAWISEMVFALNDPIGYVNDIKEAYYAIEEINETE
jgi:thymidine phosphorylase